MHLHDNSIRPFDIKVITDLVSTWLSSDTENAKLEDYVRNYQFEWSATGTMNIPPANRDSYLNDTVRKMVLKCLTPYTYNVEALLQGVYDTRSDCLVPEATKIEWLRHLLQGQNCENVFTFAQGIDLNAISGILNEHEKKRKCQLGDSYRRGPGRKWSGNGGATGELDAALFVQKNTNTQPVATTILFEFKSTATRIKLVDELKKYALLFQGNKLRHILVFVFGSFEQSGHNTAEVEHLIGSLDVKCAVSTILVVIPLKFGKPRQSILEIKKKAVQARNDKRGEERQKPRQMPIGRILKRCMAVTGMFPCLGPSSPQAFQDRNKRVDSEILYQMCISFLDKFKHHFDAVNMRVCEVRKILTEKNLQMTAEIRQQITDSYLRKCACYYKLRSGVAGKILAGQNLSMNAKICQQMSGMVSIKSSL
jgi:hypothetical protein